MQWQTYFPHLYLHGVLEDKAVVPCLEWDRNTQLLRGCWHRWCKTSRLEGGGPGWYTAGEKGGCTGRTLRCRYCLQESLECTRGKGQPQGEASVAPTMVLMWHHHKRVAGARRQHKEHYPKPPRQREEQRGNLVVQQG